MTLAKAVPEGTTTVTPLPIFTVDVAVGKTSPVQLAASIQLVVPAPPSQVWALNWVREMKKQAVEATIIGKIFFIEV